jgi:hypothetical protein
MGLFRETEMVKATLGTITLETSPCGPISRTYLDRCPSCFGQLEGFEIYAIKMNWQVAGEKAVLFG